MTKDEFTFTIPPKPGRHWSRDDCSLLLAVGLHHNGVALTAVAAEIDRRGCIVLTAIPQHKNWNDR